MQYAERLSSVASPNKLVAPSAAWPSVPRSPRRLRPDRQRPGLQLPVVQGHRARQPGHPGGGRNLQDEAGTPPPIGPIPAPSASASAKDEAATAASIGTFASPGEAMSTKNEAGTAASISTTPVRAPAPAPRTGRHRGVDRDDRLPGEGVDTEPEAGRGLINRHAGSARRRPRQGRGRFRRGMLGLAHPDG